MNLAHVFGGASRYGLDRRRRPRIRSQRQGERASRARARLVRRRLQYDDVMTVRGGVDAQRCFYSRVRARAAVVVFLDQIPIEQRRGRRSVACRVGFVNLYEQIQIRVHRAGRQARVYHRSLRQGESVLFGVNVGAMQRAARRAPRPAFGLRARAGHDSQIGGGANRQRRGGAYPHPEAAGAGARVGIGLYRVTARLKRSAETHAALAVGGLVTMGMRVIASVERQQRRRDAV